jgi:hypothetical protein
MNKAPETWIDLAEAMQLALWGAVTPDDIDIYEAEPLPRSLLAGLDPADADCFNETVANLQRRLQMAGAGGQLPMRGQPKRVMEDEPENTGRSEPIPTWWFDVDAVRGFDFEDGSILSFSHEAGETHRYSALVRPTGALQPDTPDEWRFVLVERGAFLVFLRDDLRVVLADATGIEPGQRGRLTMSRAELGEMLRKINVELGGTEEHPLGPRKLYTAARSAAGRRGRRVTSRQVEDVYKAMFTDRQGSGRLTKVEQQARKARKESAQ